MRTAVRARFCKTFGFAQDKEVCKGDKSTTEGWKAQHAKLRKEVPKLDGDQQFSSTHVLRDVRPNQHRIKDAIDLTWDLHKAAGNSETSTVVLDTSQSMQRKPFCGHFRSMTQGSTYFLLPQSRMILPREHLRLLGFPSLDSAGLKPSQVRALAGQAMGMPSVGAVMASLLLCLPGGGVFEADYSPNP